MQALDEKIDRLRTIVRGYGSALVAFSGGADSALVLKIAVDELGARSRGLIAVSPTLARREQEAARAFATAVGALLDVVASHELERPGFAANPTDRCYHCKAELLEIARPHADRLGLAEVLLGTNLDDLGDHRPGLAAARERGARSPLVEAGMTKAEVREASRRLGLTTWDKPQLACLSSRFPYGTAITPERLERVDRFEEGLHDLGFRQLRVRFHDQVARVELEESELLRGFEQRREIVALGRAVGFVFVTLDLVGFRSGAMNEGLAPIPGARLTTLGRRGG
ncbi:MAG: ATP-dependent sacrificial sulfur transferase LarE [Myxococcales bacterium]|nr:ATP-dependent sacrificial sulfur transferase LarE [Myxococcales bacterium]